MDGDWRAPPPAFAHRPLRLPTTRREPRWVVPGRASAIGGKAGLRRAAARGLAGRDGGRTAHALKQRRRAGWGLRQDVDGGGAGVEADQQGGGDAPGARLEPLVPRHAVRSQPRAAVRPHPHALLGADADALRRAAGLPRGLRGPALLVAGGRTEPGAGPGPGLPAPHRGRLPELAPDRGPAPRRGAPVRAAADAGAAARRGDQRGALARPRPGGGAAARAPSSALGFGSGPAEGTDGCWAWCACPCTRRRTASAASPTS